MLKLDLLFHLDLKKWIIIITLLKKYALNADNPSMLKGERITVVYDVGKNLKE
jgi:hypothetical protein